MQKLSLNEINKKILSLLSEYEEGLSAITIARMVGINYFVVYQRLTRLKAKHIVIEEYALWKITENGKEFLLNGLLRLSRSGTQKNENVKVIRAQNVKAKPIPPKRLNGVQILFRPKRTEHARLEALFREAGISYQAKPVKHYLQYILEWQGYRLKFTTRKLITYAPQAYASFEIEGKVLINEEINKAMNAVGSLIKKLNLKMVSENNRVWCKCSYFEIAHTESTQAHFITMKRRKSSFAPMAYDLNTLKMVSWADRSFRIAESEYSELNLEALEANRLQDIRDGKYYHREEQKKLYSVIQAQQSILELLKLEQARADRQEQINIILLTKYETRQENVRKQAWRAG